MRLIIPSGRARRSPVYAFRPEALLMLCLLLESPVAIQFSLGLLRKSRGLPMTGLWPE